MKWLCKGSSWDPSMDEFGDFLDDLSKYTSLKILECTRALDRDHPDPSTFFLPLIRKLTYTLTRTHRVADNPYFNALLRVSFTYFRYGWYCQKEIKIALDRLVKIKPKHPQVVCDDGHDRVIS